MSLRLERSQCGSFELPLGDVQVGVLGVSQSGVIHVIVDPEFVRLFKIAELELVIGNIGAYFRALHGQGLPQ